MPIYAYQCSACGHAQDVLQKISEPALTVCPTCQKDCFTKQLTAPGFQLKGSGWYATDFKSSSNASPASQPETKAGPCDQPATACAAAGCAAASDSTSTSA